MRTTHVENAHEEWDYTQTESDLHSTGMNVSIPCQLAFTEPPAQDTIAFHDALESRGWVALDKEYCDRKHTGESPRYRGEIAHKEHYNRVKVLVFRREVVRLYPKDGHVPDVPELAAITRALEAGFNAELEYSPIDQ